MGLIWVIWAEKGLTKGSKGTACRGKLCPQSRHKRAKGAITRGKQVKDDCGEIEKGQEGEMNSVNPQTGHKPDIKGP